MHLSFTALCLAVASLAAPIAAKAETVPREDGASSSEVILGQAPFSEADLSVTCREAAGRDWTADAARPGHFLLTGPIGRIAYLAELESFDYGRSWQRVPLVTHTLTRARWGDRGLRLAEPAPLPHPIWLATIDGWKTNEAPAFTPIDDPALPPGAVSATLSDASQIAVTPTGRVAFRAPGQGWVHPTDAYAGVQSALVAHSASGDVEAVVWSGTLNNLAISTDRGHSWQGMQLFGGALGAINDVGVTDSGAVLVGYNLDNEEQGVLVTEDAGQTWRQLRGIVGGFAMGPEPDEIWVGAHAAAGNGVPQNLWHSMDLGRTWERMHLYAEAGAELQTRWVSGPLGTTRIFRDQAGQAILPIAAHLTDSTAPYDCTVTASPGGIERVQVSQDDTPGVVTLWDRQPPALGIYPMPLAYVLPGLQPGDSVWPHWRFKPGTGVPIGPVTGLAWSRDRTEIIGVTAFYFDDDLPSDDYAHVFTVDPASQEITWITQWDSVGTRNNATQGIDVYPIEGADVVVKADGEWVISTKEGRIHYRDDPTGLSRLPQGRVDNHDTLISPSFGRWDLYGRLLPRLDFEWFTWGGPATCDDGPVVGCRPFSAPSITDYAVRDGVVYVLDSLAGQVWAVTADPDVAPTLVATGFHAATRIFARHFGDDDALYVWDIDLYRVTPGDAPGVRP